jgi:hypothetical protein
MKGDFSRDTFNPAKHFSRVLMQQGRVQLDADTNEQTAILLHYLRTLAADLIGPFGGPAGEAKGFAITTNKDKTFNIGMGRYYVDGILCENDQSVTYETQPDYPLPPALRTGDGSYLVYLDVWEHHVTALEDDYIREKALGGADTASRAKVVWQVKIEQCETGNSNACFDAETIRDNWKIWVEKWQSPHRGCLQARVKQSDSSTDPCLTAPEAKYRGTENQLYRVEIHQDPQKPPSFKWSRENGSVVTGCKLDGDKLMVDNPQGFTAGNWVELLNDEMELRNQPGILAQVIVVDGDVLIFGTKPKKPLDIPQDENWPTKARSWDYVAGVIKEKEFANRDAPDALWLPLEDGIEIQFLKPSTGTAENSYRTGDYWLIPARVATGNIEWPDAPDGNPAPMPPHGVYHHYAPLATLTWNGSTWTDDKEDLRCEFPPLNNTCDLSSYGEEGIGGHLLCDPPQVDKA